MIPDRITSSVGLFWTGTWISLPIAWSIWYSGKAKYSIDKVLSSSTASYPYITAIGASVRTGACAFDGRPCVVIAFVFGRRMMKFALTEHGGVEVP